MLFVDKDQQQDGFFWVRSFDIKGSGAPEHTELKGFTGVFECDAETHSDFFVGSGELRMVTHQNAERMVNAFHRGLRQEQEAPRECPTVPGSSWKGAFRTQVELFTPSCFTEKNQNCACPACSLFGKLGYRGRIAVDETFLRDAEPCCRQIVQRNKPEADRPRGEEAVYRKLYSRDFSAGQAAQRSEWEYVEALPEGTKFVVRLRFHNLARWEMGLLLFALGLSESAPFDFKAGGAKNRGMGVIRLSWKRGSAETSVDWLLKEGKRRPMPAAERAACVQEFLGIAQSTGQRDAVQQIAERLRKEYRRDV